MKKQLPLYAQWALVLFTLIALGFLIIEGKQILCPLVFGMLFSLMLMPVERFFEVRFRLHRSVASMLSIFLLLGIVASILYLVGSQLADLLDDWPQLKAQLTNSFNDLLGYIRINFHVNPSRKMMQSATNKISDGGVGTTTAIGITLITASSILLFWVFAIIDTFFLLFYRKLLLQFLTRIFKQENAIAVYEVIERIKFIISKYISGLILEIMVISTVCCTIFLISGVKYALLLGLITGLFNIIPYIGIATALLINTLITISAGAAAGKIILVAVTIVIIHLVDSNILLPLLVGSQVRINALITILGVVLGEMLWGIPGMFLSIPVIAILKIIFDRVDSLQPWGLLLGDEILEEETIETKNFMEENNVDLVEVPKE